MVSFNIVSFYINFSLEDSLQICIDVRYTGHMCLPIIPENLFLKFLQFEHSG